MSEMLALIKEKGEVQLRTTRRPTCDTSNHVLIRVKMAGICRTDLAVMRSQLATPEPLIVGHEFAGEIAEIGDQVHHLQVGMPVTAMPLLPCGLCSACLEKRTESCYRGKMLGLHVSGAFAEFVCLPAEQVFALPQNWPTALSWETAAFSEPVAAAAAILKAEIHPKLQGAIVGQGRIAELSLRLLNSQGFERIKMYAQPQDLPSNGFDWLIETGLSAACVNSLLTALRPRGLLLLKSRHLPTLQFDPQLLIRKEIRLQGVYYAAFPWVLKWLAENADRVQDLFGPVYPAQSWQSALEAAEAGESLKIFLSWP
jgi:threonine dehydrogenase-like Zn-dependent dehydrogenase